jgi:hypothetical protein
MTNYFNSLCNPAKLYAILVSITLILALGNGIPIIAVGIKLIFAFIWTAVLNYICDKGYTWFSWALVLLPFVLLIMGVLGLMQMAQSQQVMMAMQMQ